MKKKLLEKKKQRKESLLIRKKIFNNNKKAYKKLFNNLKISKIYKRSKVIGSYYSINSEIQTRELNNNILKSGKKLCFPIKGFSPILLIWSLIKKIALLEQSKL